MREKSNSHKKERLFGFQTFAERLSHINIDVIHKVGKISTNPEDANTFFLEAMSKWEDLNYTEDYAQLQKEIGSEIRNLSQIMFRQEEIISILIKHVSKENSLALDAILELIVALARDLQYEFYPHFPKFFNAVCIHFATQDTDLLEKLFTCLAYLFKFLWRYIVKDIRNVYSIFSSLLGNNNKEHVRCFAVESFAFLLRKVVNKEDFFEFIFHKLKEEPEQAEGVGQLFFEVVRGVKEQFHSCTEAVLKMLFKFLGNGFQEKEGKELDLPFELIEQALHQMLISMAKHTSQKYCIIVQNVFCDIVTELQDRLASDVLSSTITDHLNHVLKLFLPWISFKNGQLLTTTAEVNQMLMRLCNSNDFPDQCMYSISEIVSVVLISGCIKVPLGNVNIILAKIFQSASNNVILFFTRKMFQYGMFEKDILPNLLMHCVEQLKKENPSASAHVLQILSETVTTLKPIIKSAEDIKSFKKLYLYSPNKTLSKSLLTCNILESFIIQSIESRQDIFLLESNLVQLWSALVCLPHLRFFNLTFVNDIIEKLSCSISNHLLNSESFTSEEAERYAFVLCQAYFSWLCINADKTIEGCFKMKFFIDLLRKYPTSISILRMSDFYFETLKSSATLEETDKLFITHIIPNLASPFHLVRLFTLRILCALNFSISSANEETKIVESIFSICLEAEKVQVQIHSYREKQKWLQKLEYSFIEKMIPINNEELVKAPIYYLLGMLYVNFRLLWDPCIKLIKSYAHGCSKTFWDIFCTHLYEIVDLAEKDCVESVIDEKTEDISESVALFNNNLKAFCENTEEPDVQNHRLLLYKAMAEFPDVVEPKNKSFVPLIFRFINNEMGRVDTTFASSETVKRTSSTADEGLEEIACDDVIEVDNSPVSNEAKGVKRKSSQKSSKFKKIKLHDANDMDEEDQSMLSEECDESEDDEPETTFNAEESLTGPLPTEEDNEGDSESLCSEDEYQQISTPKNTKRMKKICGTKRRNVTKTLAAYLLVFSKFKNPKAMYRYVELETLYNELLSYKYPEIQKLAFDCILTYGHKYLSPYKDNFYKILDNRTFKTEVVLFSLDSENAVILEEHRMNVLPVLMRILHGKMKFKTGNNTSGKSQSHARQSLVLRFLAGCRGEELKLFFDLVFAPFKDQLNDDTYDTVVNIRQNLDLGSIVPIRKQHSALNTMALILKNLGSLVPQLLPWLLKVLLAITSTSTVLLEKRNEVLPHCITLLKSVRTLAMMRLIQFFKSFTTYTFTPDEIESVFEAIVWPMIPRLEFESLNQPSPLLRLLTTWSDNPRYFILLAKQKDDSNSLSCLPHLMALYSAPRTKNRVLGLLSKIIFQLLTLQVNICEDEEKTTPLVVKFPPVFLETTSPNFGTSLLLPHMDTIIKRLSLSISSASKKKNLKPLSPRDLKILLRISNFVDDSEQSTNFIQLLIPFLSKKRLDADSQVLILSTISNLTKKVENPENFIRFLSPLFGKLTNQNSRIALTVVFQTIAEIKNELSVMASIIVKVNSWDKNFISEPDFQQRLDGHKEALQIIKSMSGTMIDEEFSKIIFYNSCFVIRTVDDLALRNSASYLLKEIVKKISSFKNSSSLFYSHLVFDCILPEIQKGLDSSLEAVRHEFISLLAVVLHNNKEHQRLSEIARFCHEDPELDFWENICHLQFHRRARALQRFSNCLREQQEKGEDISYHYILTYMMPIVASFLFDSAYLKQIHVVDAAIETIGTIASIMSWTHYEPLLKHYLNMLSKNAEFHKTIVKVIVSIINAFHFDLSLVSGDKEITIMGNVKPSNDNKEIKETESKEDKECVSVSTEVKLCEEETANKKELAAAMSIKIYNTITKNILPLLHRSLMKKRKSDNEHKLACQGTYPEDEEVLRVPIALAMAKLLQKLPVKILERNLRGLFLKMCELLKSRAESIRQTSRETLVKMMQSLHPKYFPFLLSEMTGVMTKGYQVHVMTFTVNAVLIKLVDQFKTGDLDPCAGSLTEICIKELFSDTAEEKEVAKITGKLKEARSTKSYSIYQVLSRFVSECSLLDLIMPLREIMANKHKHKIIKKVQECLRNIAIGLSENTGLSIKKLLIFIYAICTENVPQLNQKRQLEPVKNKKYVRPDIYLIPSAPGRSGPPAKINIKTNAHILVEFGLQVLNFSLKKDRIDKSSLEIQQMLDPYIPLATDCLNSNHVKIISTSLRCLMWLCKIPLPSLKTCYSDIVNYLFILLNKYATVGMGQGENFEMVVMCFKMLTIIVKDPNYNKLSTEQLHVLLSYIEQDIFDYTRQSTAFSLLKAILSKKLESPELREIMSKVAEKAITSENDNIRAQCRKVCLQYMLGYPLGKKLQNSISFFLSQLEYHHEPGRISALELIHSMLTSFPSDILKKHSGLFLVPLSARLVNDESIKCRKMSSHCIKNLLEQLDNDEKDNLFAIGLTWLESKKLSHQRLGAQVCGIFAEVETDQFEPNLHKVLPVVVKHIEAAKAADPKTQTDERCTDHFLYHLLNSFAKMLSFCSVIRKVEFLEELNLIWEHLQTLILHPHSWVRLATSQLFGLLFSSYKTEEILAEIDTKGKKNSNIFLCSRQKLRDLSADFSTQLQSPYLNETLGEQVIRNLVYLAKVISGLPEKQDIPVKEEKSILNIEIVDVSLSWMVRRLCREAKKEVAETPSSSLKRKCVFMFIGAITHELEKEKLMPHINNLLVPLCRELSDLSANADENLKRNAQEILDILTKTVGVEDFSSAYATVQSTLFKKKVQRKHDKAIEAVTYPEKFARKRIKKQLKKKETKKRKILVQKGKRKTKKTKLTDLVYGS